MHIYEKVSQKNSNFLATIFHLQGSVHIVNGEIQTNHKFPYYKLEGSDTFMWWMWHGKVGHWVINKTPGKHLNDRVKSVFADFACPYEQKAWEGLASIHDFEVMAAPRKFTIFLIF